MPNLSPEAALSTEVSPFCGYAGGSSSTPEGRHLEHFSAVAEQRRAQLVWLAQRITQSREEAEDVVQEALLRAYRSFSDFRGDAQVSTWLRVIVQNTAREWLRSRKGKVFLPLEMGRADEEDPSVLQFADPGLNPEQACQHNEMTEILHTEIDRLGYLCRQAIQLCAIEERSLREAARSLNTSVVSVKSRIFRGKQTLKSSLDKRARGTPRLLLVE